MKQNVNFRLDGKVISAIDNLVKLPNNNFQTRTQVMETAILLLLNQETVALPERLNRIESQLAEVQSTLSNLASVALSPARNSKPLTTKKR